MAMSIAEDKAAAHYEWRQLRAQAEFAPRDGAGALGFNGRLWLLGGWNPDDKQFFPHICNSEVWSSLDGKQWTLETHAPWEPRHTAGYALHRDKMWIIGGDPIQGHYQDDVWSSSDGVHWEQVSAAVPWAPRVLHYTVAFNDRLWVMGGQTLPQFAPEKEVFYNDVWSSADGVEWERVLESALWSPRGMIGGSAVFQGRIWLLGGGTYDTPEVPSRENFNEVWSSDNGIDWKRHTDAPWLGRQYHDVAVFDNRLWVMEGCNVYVEDDNKNLNDVWYSDDGETWHEVPNTPWAPRHAASLFALPNSLLMVTGNNMESDVWELTRTN